MPIDPVSTAIGLGATYIARGFSGDKEQLVPLIKGALRHKGFALLDIISPCVTFNDHVGSTKSYAHTREHYHEVINTDFVPPAKEIVAAYDQGESMPVQLHDGSQIVFRKVDEKYDPTSRAAAFSFLRDSVNAGEIMTGLLYIDRETGDMHDLSGSVEQPLASIPYGDLNPGSEKLAKLMGRYR
jgi:2-oxoglutarate ferredoxin oxidoreductase subunit beta